MNPSLNQTIYIVSACRTPVGKFQGTLSSLRAPELGAIVIKEAIARANIPADKVEEVFMGNVIQAGVGQNPARQAARFAGVPDEVPAVTVNMVCGSGLKAVIEGARSILAGDAQIVVCGGMESMSNAPYLLPHYRNGKRLGNGEVVDAIIFDGLWDVYKNFHMGNTAELVAKKFKFQRKAIDAYALESQKKAVAALESGAFKQEIVAVETKSGKVDADEGPRKDSSLEKLSSLKPVFEEKGVVTAGNSSTLNDGAAALVLASEDAVKKYKLKALAKIDMWAQAGLTPEWVMMTPVPAVQLLLKKLKLKSINDVDLVEINEAFAVQMLGVSKELSLDPQKLNVHGGAVALGHPIGASGARILTTLIYALKRHKKKAGISALCMGGGNGLAMAISLL